MRSRLLLVSVVLFTIAEAMGQEAKPTPKGDVPPERKGVSHLYEVPLPDDSGSLPARPFDESLGGFAGRTVTRVSAIKPPPGFFPKDDADIPLGIPLNAALTRQAALRLWQTEKYRNIRIYCRPGPKDGVELLIEVQPMLRVLRLRISGNRALDNDDVARAVKYTPNQTILPEPEVLRKLRSKLLAVYAEKGYREARATLQIETTEEPGGVAMVIEIEEGRPERYDKIRIPGLPDDLSESGLAAKAGIPRGTVRDRELVDKAAQNIEKELVELGYLDARTAPFQERRISRYEIEIVIPVKPGIHTKISFHGNRHMRAKWLVEELTRGPGFGSSPSSLEMGLTRLRNYYRKNGFFHVRISALRRCRNEKGEVKANNYAKTCEQGATAQEIVFAITEGLVVEVVHVRFKGVSHFEDENLRNELFAYMREKNERTDLFQRFNTTTVDELGISDKRPYGLGKPRGAKVSWADPARIYVPELYQKAMDHLVGIYQEQGFLGAEVTDLCTLGERGAREHLGMRFVPFVVERREDSALGKDLEPISPCVMINENRDQLLVMISISEGVQTLMSEILFDGNKVLSSRVLQEASGLSVGDPYNEFRIREAAATLAKLYRSRGHMFAITKWTKSFSPDMNRAKVVFHLEEGLEVHVGRIRILGAETTSKRLIRERLTFKSGDMLTPEEIEESQERLDDLEIFDSATIQMVAPEEPKALKHVEIKVSERKPQYMELRGGIATVEGLRGGFEYGYRNLAGWAMGARLRARANYRLFFFGKSQAAFQEYWEEELNLYERIEYHLLAGLGQPHFPGSRGLFGWNIDAIRERLNEPSFSADRYTAFLRLSSKLALGKKFRRGLLLETRMGVEHSNIDIFVDLDSDDDESEPINLSPRNRRLLMLPEGESDFWVTGFNVTVDLRDNPFYPTRGIMFSIGGDLVRSLTNYAPEYTDAEGNDVSSEDVTQRALESGEITRIDKVSNLIRAQGTFSGHIPFPGTEMVFSLSVTGGYIFHLQRESTTWADRYFYAGGIETLRGFPEESLVPEDIYQASTKTSGEEASGLLDHRGGEVILLLRSEFRYPLAKGFYGALFAEMGNIWRDREKVCLFKCFDDGEKRSLKEKMTLRPVAGAGLRYLTPIGPISFDLGINLIQREHEDPFAWFLSIGTAF